MAHKNTHNYGLQFIETAELLVECGLISDAEALVDKKREILLQHYTYYGVRAAIALTRGQDDYAKLSISHAPMVDVFHSYKLIWQRHKQAHPRA